jgi:RND family efflux transporter MFP subunit
MKPIATLVLGCLAIGPAFAADQSQPDHPPRPVVSEIITSTPEVSNAYVGTIAARVEIDLGFPVIGTIAERPAEVGDIVQRDDLLARLDPQDMNSNLRAAEAGVAVATAQLRSAQSAETRAQELVARGVESATRLEAANRALTAAQARLEQAQASLARATDARGYADLRAPQDGVITQVFAEPGATLSAGDPVLRLVGTAQREAVIDVTEQDLAWINRTSKFNAALISNPAITSQTTISRIDPVADRTTRTRRVRLELLDPQPGFRLGALVRITPSAKSASNISLPIAAVRNADDGTPFVWVVDRETNQVHQRLIELGETFDTRVRILNGLAVGDEVILKGIHSVQEGQIVGRRVTP